MHLHYFIEHISKHNLFLLVCRVPCQYSGVNITFHVDGGANNNYLASFIQYLKGDGDTGVVDLKQVGILFMVKFKKLI